MIKAGRQISITPQSVFRSQGVVCCWRIVSERAWSFVRLIKPQQAKRSSERTFGILKEVLEITSRMRCHIPRLVKYPGETCFAT